MASTKKILAFKWMDQLCEKLGLEPKNVNRIIIDIPSDGLVTVYVKQFGTEALLDIEPPSAEFAKIIVDGEEA